VTEIERPDAGDVGALGTGYAEGLIAFPNNKHCQPQQRKKQSDGESPVTWQELAHRAATYERMNRWARVLERRMEHTQLLIDLGAPDPKFDDLAAEIEVFSYCLAALVLTDDAG